MSSRKKIAIITGASSGIGAEFAIQIERGFYLDEIWLIARRRARMKELSEKFLKSRGVILELDLTNKADLALVAKKLADENPEVEFLVNNAGYGKVGPFAELGVGEQIEMIELNVSALTYLSRVAIPFMTPGSKILQIASSAGFSPSPYFAVYAATKAFVVSLSDAMGYELRQHGIQVLAVCPGPVDTEFSSVAYSNEYTKNKAGGRTKPLFSGPLNASSQEVVAQALSDLSRKRRRSIFGFPMRLFTWIAPLLPLGIVLKALAKHRHH